MGRLPTAAEPPAGLVYQADLLDPAEEAEVLSLLGEVDFREVVMRGQAARRTVRHFGLDYDYESFRLTPTEPLPDQLESVRERSAALAGVAPAELAQVLVTRYPPGATIGWHRDAGTFGSIVGVSLLSGCRMRFRRESGGPREVFELALPRRSAYVLAGPSRTDWQHSIPPVPELRYSITFRTLRNPARWLS